jgi:hypothetical protein
MLPELAVSEIVEDAIHRVSLIIACFQRENVISEVCGTPALTNKL